MEWKITKLIDDSAVKCRNKLPSTDTKFKCEVRKTTALHFQNNKNNNNKLKIIKKNPHTISKEITERGLL